MADKDKKGNAEAEKASATPSTEEIAKKVGKLSQEDMEAKIKKMDFTLTDKYDQDPNATVYHNESRREFKISQLSANPVYAIKKFGLSKLYPKVTTEDIAIINQYKGFKTPQ